MASIRSWSEKPAEREAVRELLEGHGCQVADGGSFLTASIPHGTRVDGEAFGGLVRETGWVITTIQKTDGPDRYLITVAPVSEVLE